MRELLPVTIARESKAFIEEHLPDSVFYKQGKHKNILVFASRRSGSTYLAQLLACSRGVWYVDQPFELFYPHTKTGAIKCAHLPSMPLSQFITLSDEQSHLVREYMSLILGGGLRPLGEIKRWGFPFLATRTVVKITNALPLLDWFSDHFDVSTVYLLRHPIPQALSVVRNQWGITAKAYVENIMFSCSYLDEGETRLANQVMTEGTYFQRAILNWCLENIVPLKHRRSDAIVVTYEELVLFPNDVIYLLSRQLGLPNIRCMLSKTRIPAQAHLSEEETRIAIREGKRDFLISRWREEISYEQLKDARMILETFGIFEYRADEAMPGKQLRHFGRPT